MERGEKTFPSFVFFVILSSWQPFAERERDWERGLYTHAHLLRMMTSEKYGAVCNKNSLARFLSAARVCFKRRRRRRGVHVYHLIVLFIAFTFWSVSVCLIKPRRWWGGRGGKWQWIGISSQIKPLKWTRLETNFRNFLRCKHAIIWAERGMGRHQRWLSDSFCKSTRENMLKPVVWFMRLFCCLHGMRSLSRSGKG